VALVCAHFPGGRIDRSDGLLVEAHRWLGDLSVVGAGLRERRSAEHHIYLEKPKTNESFRSKRALIVSSGGVAPWYLLAVLATLPLVTSRPRRARGTGRGARPAAHVRTWSRVAIVVAVIGAIATLAAAIGALVKADGGSTPAPARLAISRIVLPAPGATPKIIRVAGTGTAGQRVRCFAKPVDGGPAAGGAMLEICG
jgi:hypothetical protein